MKGKQTSKILYNDYDHMDALTKLTITNLVYNNTEHYKVDMPTMANQIGVCDEEGNYKTVWKKIYDDESLANSGFFFITSKIFFLGNLKTSTMVFPKYKSLDPYELDTGLTNFIYDVECGFAISYKTAGSLDYYPIYFTTNFLEWYEYTGFKKQAAEGTINSIISMQVSDSGIFIIFQYTDKTDYYMAYLPFDKENISFGSITYFGAKINKIINSYYDYYNDTGTKPLKAHSVMTMYPFGDNIIGYVRELYYPPGYKYNYGGIKEAYYVRFRFIKISPDGEYESIYTNYYHSIYSNIHVMSIDSMLYRDKNNTKALFLAIELYTDTRIFQLTDDMKLSIPYYEQHASQYFQTGNGWWNTASPGIVQLFFSSAGQSVQLFGSSLKPWKDKKTGYYYSYAQVPYWNPWFPKPNSSGDRQNRFIKGCRTKDFIHYEYFDLPPYRVIENKDKTIKIRISFDSKYPGYITYFDTTHEYQNIVTGEYGTPYGFKRSFLWNSYGTCIENNKITDSIGVFIFINGSWNPVYSDEVVGEYIAYFKNYDLTPSDDDCLMNYTTYDMDPIDNANQVTRTYECRTLLDQLYGL